MSPVGGVGINLADAERGDIAAPLASLPLRQRFPALQAIPAQLVAIGLLPEHAPAGTRAAVHPQHRVNTDAAVGSGGGRALGDGRVRGDRFGGLPGPSPG